MSAFVDVPPRYMSPLQSVVIALLALEGVIMVGCASPVCIAGLFLKPLSGVLSLDCATPMLVCFRRPQSNHTTQSGLVLVVLAESGLCSHGVVLLLSVDASHPLWQPTTI